MMRRFLIALFLMMPLAAWAAGGACACAVLVSFILPTAFYLQVHWEDLGLAHKVCCGLVILLGMVGMVIGLHNTLAEGV